MHKNITKYIYALLGVILIFNSCKKEYESIEDIDDAKIQAYIKSNNLPAVKDPSGFYYQVLDPGTGGVMQNKDSVFYNVTVKSLSGNVYFSPTVFSNTGNYLGYVTPDAYREALYAINRGGKVRVIVPSYMAYGKNGSGPVPSNEVIVSEITTYLETKQWQIDDRLINEFITAKNLTMTKDPSRVYYNISQVGTGTQVSKFSTVTVKYAGRFLTGTIFDQTTGDATLVAAINALVPGWGKVLVGLKKGTKVRLIIPSDLGYGSQDRKDSTTGAVTIPRNSILDFDIEIVDVTD
ncbi:FKBP-type peptidyl-prolyl cis-trans isomerase [Pedobacter sp. UC225_65]|uniref:FKBP-type peptidyl-prolyl cis-trans isomerase n=1 Tax=Pedobacter sp. UC225_65 TaxID=3350173 RepID=UPI003672429F